MVHKGKVRELYRFDDDRLLMVATDAISAFDYVLSPTIPDKGEILNRLSLWWFDQVADLVTTTCCRTDVPASRRGRAVICERLEMIPVECVARGYLTGSGWVEYQAVRRGLRRLAAGRAGRRFEAAGADLHPGHQGRARRARRERLLRGGGRHVGADLAGRIRDLTLAVYARAESIAAARGIILADTKFEFGCRADGTVVLADEVLTPDSSRFWDAVQLAAGRTAGLLRQAVRPELALRESGWDRTSGEAPPALPETWWRPPGHAT